jgi:hypothetical protein
MGNRLFNDECLRCGTPLIADQYGAFGDYHMCSSCDDYTRRAIYEISKRGMKGKTKYYKHMHPIQHIVDVYKPPDDE